jgi:alpha-mannosidase
MYTMADVNMASGESVIRQAVMGKAWCREHLGVDPRVLDMGDCTGHPAQMPQIGRICGYDYYMFLRAVDSMDRKSEIRWKGLDGTEMPTYWQAAVGYSGWGGTGEKDQEQIAEFVKLVEDHALSPDGILAHGGDFQYPYERGFQSVARWNAGHEAKLVYSTYHRALPTIDFAAGPVVTGEWNPDRQGCYSSRIRLKQGNRECESLLFTAEAISAFSGRAPDYDGLRRAWKLTFINQFHDIIWGTHRDEVYRHSLDRIGRVRMICRNIIEDRLEPFVAGPAGERRVAVFNPLPWPRRCFIQSPVKTRTRSVTVRTADGTALAAVRTEDRVAWAAELPACGVRVFTLAEDRAEEISLPGPLPRSQTTQFAVRRINDNGHDALAVETPLYKLRFGPSGVIRGLQDRRTGLEYVDPARPFFNALCWQTDYGDLWQYYESPVHDGGPRAWQQDRIDDPYPDSGYPLTKNGNRLHRDIFDNRFEPAAEFDVIEISDHRLVLSIRGAMSRGFPRFREFQNESIRLDWEQTLTFYPDDPQIDIHLRMHHRKGKWLRLRVAFFTDIRDGTNLQETLFGRIARPPGEFAAQNYIAYFNDQKGLGVLNRGLPGSNVTNGVVMLALMRSVNIHSIAPSDEAFEEGRSHDFDYALVPFAGSRQLAEQRFARRGLEFVHAPYVLDTDIRHVRDNFRLPPEARDVADHPSSLLELQADSVVCAAVFPQDDKIVVRLYESEGQAAPAAIRFHFPVEAVRETDALLDRPTALAVEADRVALSFKPFEIKTLVVTVG